MSIRRFKVTVHLDGKSEATVEIKPINTGDIHRLDAIVSVRPKGMRIVYTGLLSDVAEIVASRHAKAVVAQQGINVPKARKGRR